MQKGYEFNSLSFIADGGAVSITVALLLLAMSVACWYLIVAKTIQAIRIKKNSSQYIQHFWQSLTLDLALHTTTKSLPVSRLAQQSIDAAEHHQQHISNKLEDRCSQDEFISRTMRRSIATENAGLEKGLTMLASVGSVAPFVGLFGTVWGIYHALASISQSGQATLDKVAGPVGETLIMTGLGLAVAIPAVLAYNALVRSNREIVGQLEIFAHELHTLLTTGASITSANADAKTIKLRLVQERASA